MNRSQRRNLTKNLKSKGISEEDIVKYIEMQKLKEHPLSNEEFLEGQKVLLNYDAIASNPDFIKNKDSQELQVIKYREFVESHKDQVMTVCYDKNHENHPWLLALEEDENDDEHKWLFWKGLLLKVDDEIST